MGVENIEVNFSLWKELVIHQVTKYSSERFIKMLSAEYQTSGVTPILYWGEGYAFRYTEMQQTEAATRDMIENGRKHWLSVEFVNMRTYQSELFLRPTGRAIVLQFGEVSILNTIANQISHFIRDYSVRLE